MTGLEERDDVHSGFSELGERDACVGVGVKDAGEEIGCVDGDVEGVVEVGCAFLEELAETFVGEGACDMPRVASGDHVGEDDTERPYI